MKYIILFVFFCFFQITMKCKIKYDLLNNIGKLSLKILSLNIESFTFRIKKNYVLTTNKKGKTKIIPFEISNSSKINIETELEIILLKRIKLNSAIMYFNFGVKSSPYATAIIIGFMNFISNILLCKSSIIKKRCSYQIKSYCNYNKSTIKFGSKIILSISIFDFIFSLLEYLFANKIIKVKKMINYK